MFCLIADVKIREATQNRKGLQDALRAIVAARATIDTEWPVERALSVGDKTTGTTVLSDLCSSWKDRPVAIDLNQLWLDLGVRVESSGIEVDSHSPSHRFERPLLGHPRGDHPASLQFSH
jgi:predicted metalloprotease with PDZ domain